MYGKQNKPPRVRVSGGTHPRRARKKKKKKSAMLIVVESTYTPLPHLPIRTNAVNCYQSCYHITKLNSPQDAMFLYFHTSLSPCKTSHTPATYSTTGVRPRSSTYNHMTSMTTGPPTRWRRGSEWLYRSSLPCPRRQHPPAARTAPPSPRPSPSETSPAPHIHPRPVPAKTQTHTHTLNELTVRVSRMVKAVTHGDTSVH